MEWQVIHDKPSFVQRILNELSPEYYLNIRGTTSDCNGNLIIILTKEEKKHDRA